MVNCSAIIVIRYSWLILHFFELVPFARWLVLSYLAIMGVADWGSKYV